MYVLSINGEVTQYPYSIAQLKSANPQTSFPSTFSDELLAEWNMYAVIEQTQPQVSYAKNIKEETPNLIDGKWYQDWAITDATQEEIAQRQADMVNAVKQQRAEAYRNESDPLFFKTQRNEATTEEWIEKVNEIKTRYPDPTF
jgi:hypothetical protein